MLLDFGRGRQAAVDEAVADLMDGGDLQRVLVSNSSASVDSRHPAAGSRLASRYS
jgi:hypothetical protein